MRGRNNTNLKKNLVENEFSRGILIAKQHYDNEKQIKTKNNEEKDHEKPRNKRWVK
uniref:Uncharacterized protein n=1 Tax=Candidatus Berkiella aquae TaxID=295108 RepID=A0A0Q9YLK3_9GAMM